MAVHWNRGLAAFVAGEHMTAFTASLDDFRAGGLKSAQKLPRFHATSVGQRCLAVKRQVRQCRYLP